MRLFLLASILFVLSAIAADLSGRWSGEILTDGETHSLYFVLKQDGNTLTGSGGPDESEQHPMQNGKVESGGRMIFDVPVAKGVFHFELSPDGDGLKGNVEVRTKERTRSGTVLVKRVA